MQLWCAMGRCHFRHFAKPNLPNDKFSEKFSGKIIHSHDYREETPFKNQRVLVVGGSFSGLDITMMLAQSVERVRINFYGISVYLTL
jgi:cation diffusion facilitator CzcD-associated flavoprotein CzcO